MTQTLNRLMAVGAALALTLASQPLTAQCCPQPDPCSNPCGDWCDMCGDWEIGAHALYWTPTACPYTFAVNDPPQVQQGQTIGASASTLKCQGDWGVRVFGRYVRDCSFWGLSYQWFESKVAGERAAQNLRIVGLNNAPDGPGKATARQTIHYQNVDLRWGHYLYRAGRCQFHLFGNAKWVDLSISRALLYTAVDGQNTLLTRVGRKAELQGGAIGVGAGVNFNLGCNFGMFGDFNVLGVIGDRKVSRVTGDFTQNGQFQGRSELSYPSDTCISPGVDFRLGVDYAWTCGCWTLIGEIGYEVDYYRDVFALPRLGDISPQTSPDGWVLQCRNVAFSGLFFGGRLLF